MGKRTRIRHWLIKTLAGYDMIVLNARWTMHSIFPGQLNKDANSLINHVEIDGTPPDVGEYGFHKTGEEAQPVTEESREYTTDEIRQQFLEQVWTIISYWHNLPAKTCRERIEGLAFSMLVILDGESAGLPAFIVAPVPHPNDKAFCISEDENFYPENHDANVKGDITGPLHELFHNIRKPKGEEETQP